MLRRTLLVYAPLCAFPICKLILPINACAISLGINVDWYPHVDEKVVVERPKKSQKPTEKPEKSHKPTEKPEQFQEPTETPKNPKSKLKSR